MLPMGLLLALCWTPVTTNQAGKPIPQFMVGEMPARGQPYQIVRIIEYVVPYPYKPQVRTTGTDSLEIIAAHLESTIRNTANQEELPLTATATPKVATNFIVKIYPKKSSTALCTGALISYRLVLTSAQCFPANRTPGPEEYRVQVSKHKLYGVSSVIFGPSSDLTRDLALMVLHTIVVEPGVQPVALCDVPPKRADSVIMYMSKQTTRFLRTQIIANRACKSSFARVENAFITPSMFCGHNSNKRRDCQTTKGDPLVHQQRLCGINIYGPSCADGATNGDLYASVFKAKAYLQAMIGRHH